MCNIIASFIFKVILFVLFFLVALNFFYVFNDRIDIMFLFFIMILYKIVLFFMQSYAEIIYILKFEWF